MGLMPSAKVRKCHYCEARAEEYHHHMGYKFEHWLSVIPVCHEHHPRERRETYTLGDYGEFKLTYVEGRVFTILLNNIGDTVFHNEIAKFVTAFDYAVPAEYTRPIINRLRKRIGSEKILSVRGIGYCLLPPIK